MSNLSFRLRLEWKVFQLIIGLLFVILLQVSVSVWSGRYFNETHYIYIDGNNSSFRLRLEWKVFQLSRVATAKKHRCFRLRLEWKVFQQILH